MKSSRARRNRLALAAALLAAALPALAAHGPGFVPKTKFVQVVRYLFRGEAEAPKPPRLPEVRAWRSTMTAEGAALDAKIVGPSLQVAGAAVRRVDRAMLSRVPPPERVVISSMSTLNAYRQLWGEGWPDAAP